MHVPGTVSLMHLLMMSIFGRVKFCTHKITSIQNANALPFHMDSIV